MIPVSCPLDLDHEIILKCNRYRFKYHDRHKILNSNCDRVRKVLGTYVPHTVELNKDYRQLCVQSL